MTLDSAHIIPLWGTAITNPRRCRRGYCDVWRLRCIVFAMPWSHNKMAFSIPGKTFIIHWKYSGIFTLVNDILITKFGSDPLPFRDDYWSNLEIFSAHRRSTHAVCCIVSAMPWFHNKVAFSIPVNIYFTTEILYLYWSMIMLITKFGSDLLWFLDDYWSNLEIKNFLQLTDVRTI